MACNHRMIKDMKDKVQAKKYEILVCLFKSKDGLTWNETSEMLNELIELSKNE